MDWRSLTQVKELGIFGYNCSCLAKDVNKIFEVKFKKKIITEIFKKKKSYSSLLRFIGNLGRMNPKYQQNGQKNTAQ